MDVAVAIFAKTPGHSAIKTRLARDLGTAMAERGYLLSLDCVARTVRSSGLPVYWAIAEDEALSDSRWRRFPRVAQGEGGLGERMHTVHSLLVERHGGAILVGADLPQLAVRHLETAAEWLCREDPRHVLGPARDGGFWLFGGNRVIDRQRWVAVKYSRTDTAQRFVEYLGGANWMRLPRLTDLDEVGDLASVRSELGFDPTPTDTQRRFSAWLDEASARRA